MLVSILGWTACGLLAYIALSKSVRRYVGPGGVTEETEGSWVPEIREAGKWLVVGSCGIFGAWGATILGGTRTAPGTTGGFSYGAPNAPTGVAAVVIDTSNVYVSANAFVGSGDDTRDSIHIAITRVGQDTTNILSQTKGGNQSRDTISDNTNLKADTTYRAWVKYKGAAAKSAAWSAWSAPDTFVNNLVLTGGGPNLPVGATLVFRLDVTQHSQTTVNPTGSFNCSANWSSQPSFNQLGSETNKYVRFGWNSGQNESDPGDCEYTIPAGTYNDLYVRVVWRANAAWETSGGGGKHIFLQNGGGGTTINAAPAFGTDGTYGLTPVVMNLVTSWLYATGAPHTPTGNWYDDEYKFTNLETNAANGTVALWVDGTSQTLSGSGSGVQFASSGDGINIIKIGPFHGGSGAKTTSNDYIDYKLIEVWKFTP